MSYFLALFLAVVIVNADATVTTDIKEGFNLEIQDPSDTSQPKTNKDPNERQPLRVSEKDLKLKRELTKDLFEKLQKIIRDRLGKDVSFGRACPDGSEERQVLAKTYCNKCPGGNYWSRDTRKCTTCPIGTYSENDGTIGNCTACPPGQSTKLPGSYNSTDCIELCVKGHYSINGMMKPFSCSACPLGQYADGVGSKACQPCPPQTTTGNYGSTSKNDCQRQCSPGFSSYTGVEPCNKCDFNTYQPKAGQKTCYQCPVGQSTLARGSSQRSQCVDINECRSNPCRNGGRCVDGYNSFTCICPPGYAGPTCADNINECASTPCYSGGTCIDKVNGYTCVCPAGFTGTRCSINVNECNSKPCVNGGTCIELEGDFECSCPAGYGGKTCSLNEQDCRPGICQNGGTCLDKLNGFTCQCPTGFRGEVCSENINDCRGLPCLNGGKCVDLVNSYRCDCPKGFTGGLCQINPNDCLRRPCANGGVCTDGLADFSCTCKSFWGGKDCKKKLSDCLNLDTRSSTIEDYVIYDPVNPLPIIPAITVKYWMKTKEAGLRAHVGTILSYGKPGQQDIFSIRTFPNQMLEINKQNWLTGVNANDGNWNLVCMTWRSTDGIWKAYYGKGGGKLIQVTDGGQASQKAMSVGKPIPGGGKFVIGQLHQGSDYEFPDDAVYQGELSGLSIWFSYDSCTKSSPDLAWPNMVFNGRVNTVRNKGLVVKGARRDQKC